jgi:hypothetical protein
MRPENVALREGSIWSLYSNTKDHTWYTRKLPSQESQQLRGVKGQKQR